MNASCHVWRSHGSHAWVTSPVNKSCYTWMRHVPYEWGTSYMNESCHICMGHVVYEWVMSYSINRSRSCHITCCRLKCLGAWIRIIFIVDKASPARMSISDVTVWNKAPFFWPSPPVKMGIDSFVLRCLREQQNQEHRAWCRQHKRGATVCA